jgi:hypothetical protein
MVLAGLKEFGAARAQDLLQRAMRVLFPDSTPPADTTARRQLLPQWPEEHSASVPEWSVEIEDIDREFRSNPDAYLDLYNRYLAYTARLSVVPCSR